MHLGELPDIGGLIQTLARLWPQALARRLESLDVRPGQVAVLRCLLERDGWTQAELCRRVGVEQPTMANTLKRMRRDGLIRQRRDPQDRRKTKVFPAGRGTELGGQLDLAESDLREAALAGLEPSQRRSLARNLEILVDNLRLDLREDVLVLLDVFPAEDEDPEDAEQAAAPQEPGAGESGAPAFAPEPEQPGIPEGTERSAAPEPAEEPVLLRDPALLEEPVLPEGLIVPGEPILPEEPSLPQGPIPSDEFVLSEEPVFPGEPLLPEEPSLPEEFALPEEPPVSGEPTPAAGAARSAEPEPPEAPVAPEQAEPSEAFVLAEEPLLPGAFMLAEGPVLPEETARPAVPSLAGEPAAMTEAAPADGSVPAEPGQEEEPVLLLDASAMLPEDPEPETQAPGGPESEPAASPGAAPERPDRG